MSGQHFSPNQARDIGDFYRKEIYRLKVAVDKESNPCEAVKLAAGRAYVQRLKAGDDEAVKSTFLLVHALHSKLLAKVKDTTTWHELHGLVDKVIEEYSLTLAAIPAQEPEPAS